MEAEFHQIVKEGFDIGEYVYHDFELCIVSKKSGDKVQELKAGDATISGIDLKCYAVTPLTLSASAFVMALFTYLDSMDGYHLNMPDIHKEFIRWWEEYCKTKDMTWLTCARAFFMQIIEAINQVDKKTVGDGILLMRKK